MEQVAFTVLGLPPVKNEATSMLAGGHPHADRVISLLRAARDAVGDTTEAVFPQQLLGIELILEGPTPPPSDATNYLGGVGDVLETKTHRGALGHLGDLAGVALYGNDRQIQEVRYRWEQRPQQRYHLRLWVRSP